eukprot:gene12280-5863_t
MNLEESHAKCFSEANFFFQCVQDQKYHKNCKPLLNTFTKCVSKNNTKMEKDLSTQFNKQLMLKNQITEKYLKKDKEEIEKYNQKELNFHQQCYASLAMSIYVCGENNLFQYKNYHEPCKDLIKKYQICKLNFEKKNSKKFEKCWDKEESLEGKSFEEIDERIKNCLSKGQNMKIFLLLILLLNVWITTTQVTEIGCILWEDTFMRVEKHQVANSREEFIFTVHTRQWNGYIGVGIFSKPEIFDDSTSIIAYLPNNFIQLKNHTEIMKKKIIFGETFQGKFDIIDGTYTFAFVMNSTNLVGKNYFAFSKNEHSNPMIKNGTAIIPKHKIFSEFKYLELNRTDNFIP